jgi:hypothetical protein
MISFIAWILHRFEELAMKHDREPIDHLALLIGIQV